MPYQIKNGIIYSGNAVTLTQAQYDALTTAEKNNGTVYYIYDSDAMIEAQEVGLDGGNVEDLAGSVATFETSPSTAVHAAGEYILYQAQLYKVTSAIAVGEDLTVGSNIEATNLGNELNNGLMNKTVYNGAWTSGGTSSIGARLTDILTLPKGTYLVTLTIPYVESGSPIISLQIGSSTETPDRFMTRMYGTIVKVIELTEETQIYGQSQGSTSVSYSYFARGGIQAVRL